MPLYTTQADLVTAFGADEVQFASDSDADLAADSDEVSIAIKAASQEIERHAVHYVTLPDGDENTVAAAGTFPGWWAAACRDMAMYHMTPTGEVATKQRCKRYEHWCERLEREYPSQVHGSPVGGTISIVGGDRPFAHGKTVGIP